MLAVLAVASLDVLAQYPAASAVLVNHDITKYSVNSTEDYIRIETEISALGKSLRDAHAKYPNLSYMPVYNEHEIIAFMINGVNDNSAANQISNSLMQLEILAEAIKSMDESFLPSAKDTKLSKVSKKVAAR